MSAETAGHTSPPEDVWASSLAQRLRVIRGFAMDRSLGEREALIDQEVRTALADVPADQRPAHLRALAESFPSFDVATQLIYAQQATRPQSVDDALAAFLELAAACDAEKRAALQARLSAAGFREITAIDAEVLGEIQARLKLGADDKVDAQRLGKLFAGFAELVLTLDQLVWNLWKSAAPQSPLRREISSTELRGLVRRSLCGDSEASAAQVQHYVETTRQLIAGLLAGFGAAGQTFGERFVGQFGPESIRAAVAKDGGGGLFGSVEARCWKRYAELAAELSAESVESDLRHAMVRHAEELVRGRHR